MAVMRFDRDQLIFKAICALDEIVDSARDRPVRGTLAMRFVLAFLYSQTGMDDRDTSEPPTHADA
jgi:hypothetical protein